MKPSKTTTRVETSPRLAALLVWAVLAALPAGAREAVALDSAAVPSGHAHRHPELPRAPEAAFDASYWIARWPGAEAVGLDATAVAARNAGLFERDASMNRLDALPASMAADAVRTRVLSLSTLPTAPRFGEDGRVLGDADHRRWSLALNLEAIDEAGGEHALGWALVTRRAALRTFPTSERVFSAPGDTDIDRFQESAFFPGTAVAVLHASADGRWRFVIGATYAGWIEEDALAHTDRDDLVHPGKISGAGFKADQRAKIDLRRVNRLTGCKLRKCCR